MRRIQSKLVLFSWPKSWVSVLKWDFLRKSQSAFLRNEGTQLSFQSHLLVLVSLKPFLKWTLAWTCSQFVKGFPLFSWCYVEPPSIPQKTTCRGLLCFKVRCKSSEWFSSGHLPPLSPHVYWINNCPAVSSKRQILTTKSCLPSFGDHFSPLLLLRASSVFHHSTSSKIWLGSVECGLGSNK